MAVPDSGVLSLLAIYNELAENNYSSGTSRTNVSLNNLSTGGNPPNQAINTDNDAANRPNGGSTNHHMSEFYSYDHNITSGTPNAPGIVGYNAASTTTIEFTYSEVSSTNRVYIYLHDLNGDTSGQGELINLDDNDYQTSDGSGNTTITIPDNDTFYGEDDDSIAPATNDYVTLKFKSRLDTGTFSNFSSTIQGWTLPTAPGAPSLTVNSTSQITATWSTPTGGASNYKVYVDAGTSSPTTLRTTQSGTSYAQTGLTVNTQYGFRIITVGGGGDLSAYSSNTSLYTLPNAPTSLSRIGRNNNTFNLGWSAPSGGASTYQVQRRLNNTGTWTTAVSSTSGTSYNITGLAAGSTYGFRVAAKNADGAAGAYSSIFVDSTTAKGGP